VIGGGKFASTFPEEVQPHFDSILVGEAQEVWPHMVEDLVSGRLQPRYDAPLNSPLAGIPPPRYDLAESVYATPIVTEATRGCPHPCTYCQLNIRRAPHRTRPVQDVIRDLSNTGGLPWHKRKMAMLLDNNLGGDVKYAKELLAEIAKLKLWGLGASSHRCPRDNGLSMPLAAARSEWHSSAWNRESRAWKMCKETNKSEYKALRKLHAGHLTFTGLMSHSMKIPGVLCTPSVAPDWWNDGHPPVHRDSSYTDSAPPEVVAEGRLGWDLCTYEGIILCSGTDLTAAQSGGVQDVTLGFYGWRKSGEVVAVHAHTTATIPAAFLFRLVILRSST